MKQHKGTAQPALGSHPVSDTAALVVEEQHEHWWKNVANMEDGSTLAQQKVPTIDIGLVGGAGYLVTGLQACGGTRNQNAKK